MTDIPFTYILVALLLTILLYAIYRGATDYDKMRSRNSHDTSIHNELSQITSRLLSQDKHKEEELMSAIKRLENVAERLEKATETIERNSNRMANSITILSLLKTIEKL